MLPSGGMASGPRKRVTAERLFDSSIVLDIDIDLECVFGVVDNSKNMPICVDRERRPNAGAKMAQLLNDEQEDEFYTSVYGGFTEEADDVDYQSESSVEDIIDSDFVDSSAAESETVSSDEDEDGPKNKKKRRHRGVVTKAYKEPKRSKPTESSKSTAQQIDEQTEPKPKSTIKEKATGSTEGEVATFESRVLRQRTVPSTSESTGTESKSRRNDSTALRRQAMLAEIAQRKNVPEVRRLTQEELLAEAKLTEEINRRSLARYQRMEIEKKKVHFQKSKSTVPMIRYHSFTVPLVEDQPHLYGVSVDPQSSTVRAGPIITDPSARCSRNLITFADEQCLRASMPKTITPLPDPNNPAPVAPRPRRIMRICPITGLPARYLDPVTLTPYANLAAFRVLRRLYQLHLETNTPAIDLLREYRNS
ncbi:hypothetical protein T265_14158, partial [Opisthorchis viverrini]